MSKLLILDAGTGLLDIIESYVTPHMSERSEGTEISLLVIHGISHLDGTFHDGDYKESVIHAYLSGRESHPDYSNLFEEGASKETSCHFMIYRDGTVVQYVPTTMKAWHAGVSSFEGQEGCNDFSIGIEMEGDWAHNGSYTKAQYETLARLTKAIQAAYPAITHERIAGHSDIAPGRKTDPGDGFDWDYYRSLINPDR